MAKQKNRDEAQVIKELALALVDHALKYDGVLTPEVEALAKELRGEEVKKAAADQPPADPAAAGEGAGS